MRRIGAALLEKGDLGEAAATARLAIAADPNHAGAWFLLSQVKRQAEPDAELAELKKHQQASSPGSPERMHLSFALGKLSDDLKEYDDAFDFYSEGNAIRRKAIVYDAHKTRQQFAEMKAAFNADFIAARAERRRNAVADDTPIFVVGMPRSGTTLVEQIIASHPDVIGGGELRILRDTVAQRFPLMDGSDLPASIARMPDKTFIEAGRQYVEALHRRFPGARHVTDKMPGNFMLIGFLHLMLPEAKIIHCRRNAAATCLSIFKSYFRDDGHLYGYNLAELGEFHNLYRDLMEYWHEVLPGVVHDVRYEDFVADQEGQSRALMDYIGLPWSEKVLAFQETNRPIRTASAAQVRQPMYKSSVDLWKLYGDRLKPLTDILGQD